MSSPTRKGFRLELYLEDDIAMQRIIRRLTSNNIIGLLYAYQRLRRFAIIPYKNTHLSIHRTCSVSGAGRLHLGLQWEKGRSMPSQMIMSPNSNLTVQGYFQIYSGHSIWINPNASFILGSGYISNDLRLSCFERIEIGNNVAISEHVTIRDSDDHSLNGSKPTKPVKIGNNVWVGLNVTILKGVTIGDGAVIAAGSVINRDVPANTLVAGIPAVVKKTGIEWN